MRLMDLTGQRFGRLIVKGRSPRASRTIWLCICDCGQSAESEGHSLRSGRSKSCGCLRGDTGRLQFRRHGRTKTPEYYSWSHMRRRCQDQTSPDYKNYGERGIAVCESWERFENFYQDMGSRPTAAHTLERKDNNKGYSPDNCVWATRAEQNQNKRNVLRFPVGGEFLTIRQLVTRTGLGYACVYKRLRKGMTGAAILEAAR